MRSVALAFVLLLASSSSAHDFEEARRIVMSVEPTHVDILVAYELRPGSLADELRAQFDRSGEGLVATPWERLARARVVQPRIKQGLSVFVDSARVDLRLMNLRFMSPPTEGRRVGIAARALYRIPTGNRLSIHCRGGRATLEAQGAEGISLRSPVLHSAPNDPVIGPASFGSEAIELHVSSR